MLLNFPHGAFKFSERASLKCVLFVWKFPWEELTTGLQMLRNISVFAPNSNRSKRKKRKEKKRVSCPQTPNRSLCNENFPPSFRWQLCASASPSGLPADLWSWQHAAAFDSWGTLTVCGPAKGPLSVSEVRSERTGAQKKRGVQLGEDQKRHKLQREPLWGTQWLPGSDNFSLCVCVFLTLLLSPALIFFLFFSFFWAVSVERLS